MACFGRETGAISLLLVPVDNCLGGFGWGVKTMLAFACLVPIKDFGRGVFCGGESGVSSFLVVYSFPKSVGEVLEG